MIKRSVRGSLISSMVFLAACSSSHKKTSSGDAAMDGAVSAEAQAPAVQEAEVSSEDVEQNIEKPYKSTYGEIALDDNEYVQTWIRYFQGRGRHYMDSYLARSTKYLPMMKNVLRENGLPEDLVYISLIESGFSPTANSRASAVGYWQFMRATGRRFGLTVDAFIDERRDPVLSTRAAAAYFKELYSLFGSWHLAMSAYNVGENRVKRAVTKYYTRDLWALIKKRRSLPPETKQYVPKFIAAALIAKDPAKYGFKEISYEDPLSYDTVALQSPISLTKLSSNLNVDLDEMKLLNPKFRSDFVPIAHGQETVVRIPVGRGTDAMAALSLSVSTQPKLVAAVDNTFYRIRRGDNLSTVAHKNHTTVSQLRRLNSFTNRTTLRVGMRIKVPDNKSDGVRVVTEEDAQTGEVSRQVAAVPAVETKQLDYHVVRRGENLSSIAQRYGVSLSDLRKLNHLSSRSVIRRGQRLKIRASNESSKSAGPVKKTSYALASAPQRAKAARLAGASLSKRHVVRRGETLYDVSKKYGVNLSRLAKANGFNTNYRVMAGERLTIPE